MNHIERFYATVNREPVDRPATWLGLPDPEAVPGLLQSFGVKTMDALRDQIDDDIYPVELPYHSPISNAIYDAFHFAIEKRDDVTERTLTSPGFFQDYTDPSKIDDFDWPNPLDYISIDECKSVVDNAPKGKAILGVLWASHFQEACAAFGMEKAMMNMILEPEIYRAVDDKIVDFYLKANERFYEATKGKLHAVLIGNDMGSQLGLLMSPDMIRKFVLPGSKKLIAQAKSYGLKVIYHSCGSIYDIIPDLIEAGVDIIHPIQAKAKNMGAEGLKKAFNNKVSFCGGVDAQELLITGTTKEVEDTVIRLKTIFPTGLILSPSHEAILKDTNPENLKVLFKTANRM